MVLEERKMTFIFLSVLGSLLTLINPLNALSTLHEVDFDAKTADSDRATEVRVSVILTRAPDKNSAIYRQVTRFWRTCPSLQQMIARVRMIRLRPGLTYP